MHGRYFIPIPNSAELYETSVFHSTKQYLPRSTVRIRHILIHWKKVIKAEQCYSPVINPTQKKTVCNKETHEPIHQAKPSQFDDYSQWSTRTQVR